MVKHGTTKKRRSGRTGRTKLKNRNYQFYRPPQIHDGNVRAHWNPRKSPAQNFMTLGLKSEVNSTLDPRRASSSTSQAAPKPSSSARAVDLFDIPESDSMTIIPGKKFTSKLPLNPDEQKYIARCLAKHGDDFKKMARDMKLNDMQHTEAKMKKMAARFFLLTTEQLRTDIPSNITHLMNQCQGEEEGGEEGR